MTDARAPSPLLPSEETLERLRQAVGPAGWSQDPEVLAPHLTEWRDRWQGQTPLLIKPGTTEEVAEVVRICADTGTAIVPQGGNTGLVGAQIPFGQILLSLARLNRIRALDATNNTVTVEAGCVLATLQEAAEAAGRLFPLALASQGSAQIGGLISTNAGGTAVVRYGTMRALVLGLEVVTADGAIWNGLTALRKNTTGYDLKQLFIGAEGTLGVITAAVCRLVARPADRVTALLAFRDLDVSVDLLNDIQAATGEQVSAFELMPRLGVEFVTAFLPESRDPFPAAHPWYALIDVDLGGDPAVQSALRAALERCLARALERNRIQDAILAQDLRQAEALWRLRECLSEAQKPAGASLKHDVSVPVSAVPAFIHRASEAVEKALPGIRPVPFGHIGDGNIHFNLSQPEDMDPQAFLGRRSAIARLVYDIVAEFGGAISAEHGIGLARRDDLRRTKSAIELDLMRRLKSALDPDNIMNPGKIL